MIYHSNKFKQKQNTMRKIITSQDCPPIPVRDYDWSASREDYDQGDLIGYGITEQDAIDDLKRQENEC
jgi:hypothetical protein